MLSRIPMETAILEAPARQLWLSLLPIQILVTAVNSKLFSGCLGRLGCLGCLGCLERREEEAQYQHRR